MWTLIILMGGHGSSTTVAVGSVPGFSDKQFCQIAGIAVKTHATFNYTNTTTICVQNAPEKR